MGLFSIFKKEERAETVKENSSFDDILSALLNEDTVTKQMALQIPSISGTIDLIGSIIASTPIKLYREKDGKAEEITGDKRVFLLNDETGDTLNANEFWKAIVRDYYTGKGGYAYIHKEKGKVKSLHYVDCEHITINKNFDYIFKDFNIIVNGKSYFPFQFIKVLRNTKDGAEGIPITEENSKLISVMYAALKLEMYASKRGGNKKGFLKSEKKLDENVVEKLKAAFKRLYSDDRENFIVLNSGIDFKESSNTLAEMQLNENKLTNASEVAKLFHVSPDSVSGKNLTTSVLAKLAAVPLMCAIQSALNKDLLLEREKENCYFAFDTKELLKGDMGERFNAYKTALDSNFMQIDEIRYLENLEPLGLNFVKLGLQDVLYDPKTKQVFTPNTGKTQNIDGKNLLDEDKNDIISENRANPHHDSKTGQFTSGGSSSKNIKIGKSLGASGKNYPVKLPEGGYAKFAQGSEITKIKVIAGKGSKTDIRNAVFLENKYNIPANEWKKMRGEGTVIVNKKPHKAEVHWYEANDLRVEMKVKVFFDES